MIGQTIAHYDIVDLLGKGGMGEVYRARDTKLDREVALKVLPPETANNPERLARLEREAKLLASVNHQNIAAIHGIEEVDGKILLVMELAEGEELGARIDAGLPLEQALDLARQICEGLEEAHAKGIVHRDLKPANIMVSPDGQIKILDFGLARAFANEPEPEVDSAFSPTITAMHTMAGTIIGTAAYMSPEQARGLTVDKRTDIFAFGTILFEMLTGNRVFDGSTVSDKLAAIIKSEPDWALLPGDTPARLRELLERCLAKKRRNRMQDIGDVRFELERIQAGDMGVATEVADRRRGLPLLPTLVGVVLLALIAAFGAWSLAPRGGGVTTGGLDYLSLDIPAEFQMFSYLVAPDGRTAIYATPRDPATPEENVGRIYLRGPGSFDFEPVPGSESARNFCFSADSRWLAMVAPEKSAAGTLHLWKVATDFSTPPLKVQPWSELFNSRSMHWLPDGDLVTSTRTLGLLRIPMDGRPIGDPVKLGTTAGGNQFSPEQSWASLLPDGIHLLATINSWDENGYARNIHVANVNTGEVRLVIENGAYPRWLEPGYLIFSRGTSLLAVRFDPDTQEVRGGLTAVADGLRTEAAWAHGEYAMSRNGHLYFSPGGLVGQQRTLAFTDRDFKEFTTWTDDPLPFDQAPVVSPDGKHVAAVMSKPDGTFETWVSRLDRPGFRRFAAEQGRDVTADVWAPDGSQLVLTSFSPGNTRILVKDTVGNGTARKIYEVETAQTRIFPTELVDEGRFLLVSRSTDGRRSVELIPLAADGETELRTLIEDARAARISPDGRWLIYQSTIGGQNRIQVRRWFGEGRLGPEFQVTADNATFPRWYRAGPDGPLEIWYFHEAGLWSVTMTPGQEPEFGRPELVVEGRQELLGFDILPDGRLLTRMAGADEEDPGRVDVILNWAARVRQKMDTP